MNYSFAYRNRTLQAVLLGTLLFFSSMIGLSVLSSVSAQQKTDLCRGANLTFNKDKNSCTTEDGTSNLHGGKGCGANANEDCTENKVNNLVNTIVDIFSVIVGIVAVIMLMIGGFRYITSGGDSGGVTTAKNTIIYAIIGLIVVAFAQSIVKYVLNKATG